MSHPADPATATTPLPPPGTTPKYVGREETVVSVGPYVTADSQVVEMSLAAHHSASRLLVLIRSVLTSLLISIIHYTTAEYFEPVLDSITTKVAWAENQLLTLPFYTPHKNCSASLTFMGDPDHSTNKVLRPATLRSTSIHDTGCQPSRRPYPQFSYSVNQQFTHVNWPNHHGQFTTIKFHRRGRHNACPIWEKADVEERKATLFCPSDGNVSSTTPSKSVIPSESDPNSLNSEVPDLSKNKNAVISLDLNGFINWHSGRSKKYMLEARNGKKLGHVLRSPPPATLLRFTLLITWQISSRWVIRIWYMTIQSKASTLDSTEVTEMVQIETQEKCAGCSEQYLELPAYQALTRDERDLVWRFRFYLSHDKRALTKFLKSVVWLEKGEDSQAIGNLLLIWSVISLDDALELLGPSEDYWEPRVKQFAVQQLARAEDDELVLHLLQPVQALKFDRSPSVSTAHNKTSPSSTVTSPIAQSQRFSAGPSQRVSVGSSSTVLGRENRSSFAPSPLSLEDFLIKKSCANPTVLGYQFYWYLTVEASAEGDKSTQVMYGRVLQKFYDKMRELANEIRTSKDRRPKKIEKVKHVLKDPAKLAQLFSAESTSQITGFPLPLDSSKMIVGVDTESLTVFKSNLFPLRLTL
ncbi:hypothetical protein PTTG_28861 [Puccinia triticina 1-1 BBBD Race 1]|uniref:PIK helical domain-containing protein n=1 Tax=Puccinia triticina (isolate 1-1 / race 1 (BBBD)) TaxID=630390 RepID=A0A180G8V3_PUCT1|nr:hypothetical protein PTTG_28861 [Puccinia triticina 1-1 BBBD Race 1]